MTKVINYVRNFFTHTDSLGIIGNWDDNPDRDRNFTASPGDEAQRMGMYWAGLVLSKDKMEIPSWYSSMTAKPSDALDILECKNEPGNYRRYHMETHWTSACDRLTRDQATGIAALFWAGSKLPLAFPRWRRRLLHFMWNMVKRLGFTNNYTKRGLPRGHELEGKSHRDWFGFAQWAICLRTLGGYWFYILYLWLDLELLVSSLQWRLGRSGDDDSLNYIMRLLICNSSCPTPWSWMAAKLTDPARHANNFSVYFNRVFPPYNQIGPPFEMIYTEQFLREAL